MEEMGKRRLMTPLCGLLVAAWCCSARATELDRGHRILIDRGLQIQASVFVPRGGVPLSADRWAESNFSTASLYRGTGSAGDAYIADRPWGRWIAPGWEGINTADLPYESQLVSLQYNDEQDMKVEYNRQAAANFLSHWRVRFPNTLSYTNQGNLNDDINALRQYMQLAQPDMMHFSRYPFMGDLTGGSPKWYYERLQEFRLLGLGGHDGTGTRPIPYGTWLQTYERAGHTVSESEMRLNQFSSWAFGAKFANAFIYNSYRTQLGRDLFSVLFDKSDPNYGDAYPTPAFYQMAELNRQSRNLGPTLVRLLSTDVRFIPGHNDKSWQWWPWPPKWVYVENEMPDGVSRWDAGADPYITDVSATNQGSLNEGLRGDVVIGYFNPLLEEMDGPDYEDEIYFMILNGLTDSAGSAAETRQRIRIDFDFGTSGINSLQRLSRETGEVEEVPLVYDGSTSYHLDLILDGGTGDLFKFNTGAPWAIAEPSTIGILATGLLALGIMARRLRRCR